MKYPIKHIPSKRIFDILFSLFVIIFFSYLFIIVAILVFIFSKGSVFYISERIGRGGKIIKCIKFRTMYKDAETKLKTLLNKNIALKKEWEKFQKLKNDPRITPIGKFLRKTSLDELPQFFNVIKGDLSIVGPRPFVLVGPKENYDIEIRKYLKDKTEKVLSIRPGITGLWQISGRSELSIDERVELEIKYIEKRSFFYDLYLVLMTIPRVLFPKGAY
ncbi:MAG: sugar transferase [Parachlamydiales bacterium]|nr:sugar transferase [Parachlamydiales bacterium]